MILGDLRLSLHILKEEKCITISRIRFTRSLINLSSCHFCHLQQALNLLYFSKMHKQNPKLTLVLVRLTHIKSLPFHIQQ